MSTEPTTPPEQKQPKRVHAGLAAVIVVAALVGGGVVGKQLLGSHAAVKTAITDTFGQRQAALHVIGSPTAPFLGPYKLGQCGPGVRLMEGALHNLPKPVRKAPPANCFGKATKAQVVTFQKRLHYKPTGVYNLATHTQLVKRGGYSSTAKAGLRFIYEGRLKHQHVLLVQQERRTVQIVSAHVAKVGGSTLAYSQGGTRGYFPAWPRIPPDTDCSGMATYVLYQAGVGAAVGYYGPGSSVGWTGTLRYQGQRISYGQPSSTAGLQPGDLVFYGRAPNWSHVATYIGSGLVMSHGQVGVNVERYNYRPVGEIRRYIF